ncbi:MAG: sigma-54-dependent Fis family transcriptional regulator, partial [Planctomycetes bacterium]|nr:sigma-54-dependent Fis family transcriptional regulator [Planctomycetota bacterium]
MPGHHLLIADDEPDLRWVLRGLFEDEGFTVTEAGDGEEALQRLEELDRAGTPPDVVLSDMRMPRRSGLELLHQLRRDRPDLPLVLLSAVEDLATAVDAIKEGAFDYQAKPFDEARLVLAVRRAAEQHALRRELQQLRYRSASTPLDFGPSRKAQDLRRRLELVAPQTSVSVLLCGESGTGKEVAARAVHHLSPLQPGPFVAVDCGALPEHLLESQLFGHEKGAFTGADRAQQGLFAMADGGTLFLDELGNLPLPLQAKLLRALQERVVVPVGGRAPVPFRARLIAATNADLCADVEAGRFRVDLYHRVAEFVVPLPALRERPDDIVHFARAFLAQANVELGRRVAGFTDACERALRRHPWPGNLRELRNQVRRMVLLATTLELDEADLTLGPATPGATSAATGRLTELADEMLPLAQRMQRATDALEATILTRTLAECEGNKAAAARALQIDYTTLHRKLKRHGLQG